MRSLCLKSSHLGILRVGEVQALGLKPPLPEKTLNPISYGRSGHFGDPSLVDLATANFPGSLRPTAVPAVACECERQKHLSPAMLSLSFRA